MRALVVCGGHSLERTISLESGRRASRALRDLGLDVETVDAGAALASAIATEQPDFIFLALHGAGGEDGGLQDVLDALGIPYTGSAAPASSLCLDKHAFKAVCEQQGLPTPRWRFLTRQSLADYSASGLLGRVHGEFGRGCVVKPARQGSSLGITLARSEKELTLGLLEAMNYDDRAIVEEYVVGREIAVTVIGQASSPEVLPPVELLFDGEIYSYAAHYNVGSARVVRAQLSDPVLRRVEEVAARAYSAMGCRDFARVDLRLDKDGPWLLEINTIPGLTETGPAPLAAEFGGLDFVDFVAAISQRARSECHD